MNYWTLHTRRIRIDRDKDTWNVEKLPTFEEAHAIFNDIVNNNDVYDAAYVVAHIGSRHGIILIYTNDWEDDITYRPCY